MVCSGNSDILCVSQHETQAFAQSFSKQLGVIVIDTENQYEVICSKGEVCYATEVRFEPRPLGFDT